MSRRTMANTWGDFLPRHALVMARRAPAVASSAPEVTPPSEDSLDRVAAELEGCTRCKLCSGRRSIVVGEGNPAAELMFIGEGPGEAEDAQGRPFVGPAGQLLDRMIEAMGLRRDQVYLANAVKCRSTGNRDPEPDEVATCRPFLERQIALVRPRVIVALGQFATQTLLETELPLSALRGRFHDRRGVRLMPTWHPADLLRSPESKRETWVDLQAVAQELGLAIPARGGRA